MIKQSINNNLQDNKAMEIANTDLSRATCAKPIKFPPLQVTGLIDKVEAVGVIQPHFNKALNTAGHGNSIDKLEKYYLVEKTLR